MNRIQKVTRYIKNNKLNALLPQNLNGEVLRILLQETEALSSKNDDMSAASLLMVLLALKLKKHTKIVGDIELEFEGNELMDNMNMYCTFLKMEDMRRQNKIQMPDTSLPTLENIFDKNRKIQVQGLDNEG
jgi:hypothetical protein